MRDKLKMGMVGGGNGGNIGNSHRRGAAMDNLAVLTAGSLQGIPGRIKRTECSGE